MRQQGLILDRPPNISEKEEKLPLSAQESECWRSSRQALDDIMRHIQSYQMNHEAIKTHSNSLNF